MNYSEYTQDEIESSGLIDLAFDLKNAWRRRNENGFEEYSKLIFNLSHPDAINVITCLLMLEEAENNKTNNQEEQA